MSDKRFEIAFSGQIVEGADLETVKQKIAAVFKPDEKRLAQMFSGQRVLIKRQVDEITALKYRGAFQKAGAVCEVVELSTETGPASPAAQKPAEKPVREAARQRVAATSAEQSDYVSKYPESDQIPQALLSQPLGISGDSIQDLGADVAPVGSPMQHQISEVDTPAIDTSGLDMAPVGSEMSTAKGDEPPPPPDTSGLSMAD